MTTTAYMHDVDLGEPLTEDAMLGEIAAHADNPGVQAVAQLLRNRTCESDRAAREAKDGVDVTDYRARKVGEAAAYEEAFWFVIRAAAAPRGEKVAAEEEHEEED